MNTTFFIGNGFDVCLGLETRYVDFYEKHYTQLKDDNTSEAVKNFRKAIDQYIKDGMVVEKDEIDWSDLESALGKYANEVKEPNDYIDIILDVNRELRRYIESQDANFTISEKHAEKIYKDFCSPDFQPYLNLEESASFAKFKKSYNEAEYIDIISFNYTNTIEKIFKAYTPKAVVLNSANYPVTINNARHIHSQLGVDQAIIVGVNDPSQIDNEEFRKNQDILDIVVKPQTNKMFGNGRIAQVSSIISHTKLFVLYGVSLGETDKMWWKAIGEAMINNSARLIYFVYEKPEEENPLLIGRKKREFLDKFCKQAAIPENNKSKISLQLFIGYNKSIFK